MLNFDLKNFYEDLRRHFDSSNKEEIISFFKTNYDHVLRNKDNTGIISVGNEYASYLRVMGETTKSYKIYDDLEGRVLNTYGSDSTEYASILLNIGDVDIVARDFSKALTRFNKVEDILGGREDEKYLLASLYNNRSSAYRELGDLRAAEKDIKMAIDLMADRKLNWSISLINLAEVYILQGEFIKAERIVLKAIRSFKDNGYKDDIHYANALATAGRLYYFLGDYEKSSGYYSCALNKFSAKFGDSPVTEIIRRDFKKVNRLLNS